MKRLLKCSCIIYLIIALPVIAQKKINLTSPDGHLRFYFKLVNKTMMYSVVFKGSTIIDYSSLGLQFENDNFETNLTMNKPVYRDTSEDYELIVGKTKQVHTHYKEVKILPFSIDMKIKNPPYY